MKPQQRESILWIEAGGFSFLILCVWLIEWLHLPHYLFAESATFNIGRPIFRSVVVLLVWIVVHLATRRLLKRLHHLEEYLLICAWCRRLGHHGEWMTTEEYFGSALTMKTTHGMCPQCRERMLAATGGEKKSVR